MPLQPFHVEACSRSYFQLSQASLGTAALPQDHFGPVLALSLVVSSLSWGNALQESGEFALPMWTELPLVWAM